MEIIFVREATDAKIQQLLQKPGFSDCKDDDQLIDRLVTRALGDEELAEARRVAVEQACEEAAK